MGLRGLISGGWCPASARTGGCGRQPSGNHTALRKAPGPHYAPHATQLLASKLIIQTGLCFSICPSSGHKVGGQGTKRDQIKAKSHSVHYEGRQIMARGCIVIKLTSLIYWLRFWINVTSQACSASAENHPCKINVCVCVCVWGWVCVLGCVSLGGWGGGIGVKWTGVTSNCIVFGCCVKRGRDGCRLAICEFSVW